MDICRWAQNHTLGRTIHSTKTISLQKTKAIGRVNKVIVAMKGLCYFPYNTPDIASRLGFINPRYPSSSISPVSPRKSSLNYEPPKSPSKK